MRACTQRTRPLKPTNGLFARMAMASLALARIKSMRPTIWTLRFIGSCSRAASAVSCCNILSTSRRSSYSSSLILLLPSSTSAGSRYTVWPVLLSSCTKPFIRRLCSAAIGITKRPPRSVISEPSAAKPSRCAWRRMLSIFLRRALCSSITMRRRR